MIIAAFLCVAIVFYGIAYLVIMFGFLGVLERRYSRKTARKLLFTVPILFALIGGLLQASIFSSMVSSTPSSSSSLSAEDLYGHDEFDAAVIAEKIVKNNLKVPSTAKFCKHSEYTITCSVNTWTVSGYVDAENSFGAAIRSAFTVTFTFTGSEEYMILSCDIA